MGSAKPVHKIHEKMHTIKAVFLGLSGIGGSSIMN
jgi:putative ribosome biogenesis GTPase RsgA